MRTIVPILLDTTISNQDKVRIIALAIMFKNGISEDNFKKLATHAQIEQPEREMILNLTNLGVNVTKEGVSLSQNCFIMKVFKRFVFTESFVKTLPSSKERSLSRAKVSSLSMGSCY